MVTTVSAHAYWTNPETWTYFQNLSLTTIAFNLPGVFADNPFRNAVNGSLWTLPVEVTMYAVTLACGIVGLIRKRFAFLLLTLVMLALDMRYFSNHAYFMVTLPWLPQQALGSCFHFCVLYMAGGLLYLFRASIALDWKFGVIAILMYFCSFNTPHFRIVQFIAIPYFVIFAAHYPSHLLSSFGKYGDFSYGLYIYAFPIQQLIAHYQHGKITVGLFFIESFVATYICAALSWYIVEQPALNVKRFLKRRSPPAAFPTSKTTEAFAKPS
jgi:peptidoglycan/LPS O-acetylase OafA/YrhL